MRTLFRAKLPKQLVTKENVREQSKSFDRQGHGVLRIVDTHSLLSYPANRWLDHP